MTREITVDLTRRGLGGDFVSPKECFDIIMSYCREMGKNELNVMQFISMIHLVPGMTEWCFGAAMEYYRKKFGVNILYEQDGDAMKAIAIY